MTFEERFTKWLDESLAQGVPSSVQAFSFNLYEPAHVEGVKFSVELIGAGHFDKSAPDWACDEVWQPIPRGIGIPLSFSGASWRQCLNAVQGQILAVLRSKSTAAAVLASKQAIGVGFVDGDLNVIWPDQSIA